MTRSALVAVLAAAVVLSSAACGGSGSPKSAATTTGQAAKPKASKPAAARSSASSGSGQSAPAVPDGAGKKCLAVPGGLRTKIAGGVILIGATLHHIEAVASPLLPGFYFVSATVDGSGTRDKLATWATQRLDGRSPVYAVDSFAALISTYAAATQKNPDLSTKSPGSFRSRICAGGPTADEGIDAPASGVGNAPATG